MSPGPLGNEGNLVNSLLGGGSVVSGGMVKHSILFPQVRVEENAVIEDTILFDGVHVGAGAHLKRCIVDKNVRIPPGERIGLDSAADAARFTVSESGVTVVPKGYRFPVNPLQNLVDRATALSLTGITALDEETIRSKTIGR